jgi:hypothetical protein
MSAPFVIAERLDNPKDARTSYAGLVLVHVESFEGVEVMYLMLVCLSTPKM